MSSYTQVAESYVSKLLVGIHPALHQSVKLAILGGDEDILGLLHELPNSPGLKTLTGQQVSVWIDECKLEIVLLQLREGLPVSQEKLKDWIVATSLRAQTVPECDGEARFDFIPSRVLLSAALQLDRSQLERVELDLGKIGRDDPLLWHHPMLTDESSGTREWFMGGRQTPVPGPVRPTAGPPVAIPFNPIIVEGDVNLRSRQELLDVIPQADHHSLVIHLPSKASSTKTGPKPRKIRVKSREYVADSSDEMMEEGDRSETGGERGRVMVRTDKGKGKEISEETRDSGIQEVVKEEPMDVDLVPKQLTEVPSGPSGPSRRTQMPKKSSMKPGKDTAPEVNIGNSEACEKCVKRGTSCVYGGRVACEACRAHKQKCTGVSKDWRKQVKAKMSSEDTRATTPALGKAPETSSSSTTPRRSSRARSVSRPAEPPTALHAPNRESTAKPQMTPKRNTTPKRSTTPKTTTPKPTQKTATTTKAKPQSKGRSTSRGRSKGKSRQVDNDDVSDEGETGRGSPAGVMVPELGQVPSRYMYLVKRDGEEVTGGVRVEEGGTTMRESDSGVLERLQRENEQLMKEMTAMREEMRKLKETVVGLEMRQSVLISHHNAHTSLLERHRQALTTLTSQPPTPSDRRTPVDDQGVHRLSMPPSRFGSITPTCNSAPYIRPPVPSPNPEYVDSMSPFSTPRTNRMFTEFVHPSMLQLNMLQISANESVAHGLQVAPDLPMEEDIPDAGPFPVATARDEEARAHGSGVVTKVSFEEDISEKVGSGEAGASGLGDKQKAMLPGMPISAMRMLSPTSQTDMNYDDPEDPCAMALDSPQEALQKGQGQLDRHWDTII